MRLANVHLFNTGLCYAPILVSFCVNFACFISNFVSVIVLSLGFNFHNFFKLFIYIQLNNHSSVFGNFQSMDGFM